MKPGKKIETYQAIVNELEPRLNIIGFIQTKESWDICRDKGWAYSTITSHFRKAMEQMVYYGKAKKIRDGHWKILVPYNFSS